MHDGQNVRKKIALLWDVSNNPECSTRENYDLIVLWRSYAKGSGPCISILREIEKNEKDFKDQYLRLIYELGILDIGGESIVKNLQISDGFSFWWMMPITEKCNYQNSKHINTAIKLLALNQVVTNNNLSEIHLVTEDINLVKSIQNIGKKFQIEINISILNRLKLIIRNKFWRLKKYIKITRGILWIIKYIAVHSPFIYTNKKYINNSKENNGEVLVSTYLINSDCNFEEEINRYWGDFKKIINKNKLINWLYIYAGPPTFLNSIAIVRKINIKNHANERQNNYIHLSFLSLSLIKNALYEWVALIQKFNSVNNGIRDSMDKYQLWPLFQDELMESIVGKSALSRLLNFLLIKKFFSSISNQECGFFLMENQGWEFALTHEWSKRNNGNLIGVPHTTVKYWDLRYYCDKNTYIKDSINKFPMPHKVAVNGPLAYSQFVDGSYPISYIEVVEALRYSSNKKIKPIAECNQKKILIISDYSYDNNIKMIEVLNTLPPSIYLNYEFILKEHPGKNFPRNKVSKLKIHCTQLSIEEVSAECNIAYCSSYTSGAVDAFCVGLKVICQLDGRYLNMSPLKGIENVSFISDAEELCIAIQKEIDFPENRKNTLSEIFLIDSSYSKWHELFKRYLS